ncbi:MAG: protein kinase family protein [Nocardioides sp.]|nr:protein kinase family protein [Nocardioides sp.]
MSNDAAAASADDAWGPGALLADRYRLEDLLAERDGARFWRATDNILARDVAVHVLPADDRRADAVIVAARTSAAITDGHFLRVLDADIQGGVAYVVVEWGSGISLDHLLAEGPLPPRRAAWLVKQVAEAISTAHAHGIAHGRLIPENVLVTETGAVKLVGFVIDAVLSGRQEDWGGRTEPLSDHESDVVNLAGLLYAALTARWPGTSESAVAPAPVEHGRPLRPRQVRAGIPRPLDAICQRVLHADAQAGQVPLETAHEVAAALSDYVGDPTSLHRPEMLGDLGASQEHTAVMPHPGAVDGDHADRSDESERARAEDAAEAEADAEATALHRAGSADDDLDATQAGVPVFDDDTGGHWAGPGRASRLRSDDPPAPVPPPPVLPEPEPKPLFAPDSGPRGGARPDQPLAPPRGLPAPPSPIEAAPGDDPAYWPWRHGDDDRVLTGREDAGRNWLRVALAVTVVLLLLVAVVIAFDLGRRGGSDPSAAPTPEDSPTATSPSLSRIPVADVVPLDPPPAGNGEENDERAGAAIDGDPSTTWVTERYFDQFPSLKPGVGLVLDLGEVQEVAEVRLRLDGGPSTITLYGAGDGDAPGSIEGLDELAGGELGAQGRLTLDEPADARYLVVWFERLPPVDGGFRAAVSGIVVRG